MRFLELLEKAWIVAAAAALVVALYNVVTVQAFNHQVYFPLLCAMFCGLLWFNVRGQRRFKEKMDKEEVQKRNSQSPQTKP